MGMKSILFQGAQKYKLSRKLKTKLGYKHFKEIEKISFVKDKITSKDKRVKKGLSS